MKVAIIIPYFNRWDLTHQTLMSIYKFINHKETEIILINDASTEGDCETGAAWWQSFNERQHIRYYKNRENLGFAGSMNNGAKIAMNNGADFLVFLSNDVLIFNDFLSDILAVQETKGPKVLIGGEVVDWPGGWNEFFTDSGRVLIPYANGWLLACTVELWKEIGGFDKRYGRYDYEDIDVSAKVHALGYNVVGLNSTYLKHIGGATIYALDANRIEHTKKNRELFIAKWFDQLSKIGKPVG